MYGWNYGWLIQSVQQMVIKIHFAQHNWCSVYSGNLVLSHEMYSALLFKAVAQPVLSSLGHSRGV